MKTLVTSLLAAFAISACAWGDVRPFTIENVLSDLARSHPQARRAPDALPEGVIARENLTYSRPDGSELQLDVYQPSGDTSHAAILIVHGGGWLTGDRTMERPLAKQLAGRGYVAVPVSYRLGTPGRFPAPVLDLKAAVRWLRAHAAECHIDVNRIAIAGGSAGGTLATFVGATNGMTEFDGAADDAKHSSVVQAAIDIDGTATFMDNALIRASEAKPDNPYLEFLHGPYRRERAVWLAASPIMYVNEKSAPTLFIKSVVTQPILVGRDEMSERLRTLGIASEVVTYPGTPHPFWLVLPWFNQTIDDTDKFLRKVWGAP